jgi:hypothetical protein
MAVQNRACNSNGWARALTAVLRRCCCSEDLTRANTSSLAGKCPDVAFAADPDADAGLEWIRTPMDAVADQDGEAGTLKLPVVVRRTLEVKAGAGLPLPLAMAGRAGAPWCAFPTAVVLQRGSCCEHDALLAWLSERLEEAATPTRRGCSSPGKGSLLSALPSSSPSSISLQSTKGRGPPAGSGLVQLGSEGVARGWLPMSCLSFSCCFMVLISRKVCPGCQDGCCCPWPWP